MTSPHTDLRCGQAEEAGRAEFPAEPKPGGSRRPLVVRREQAVLGGNSSATTARIRSTVHTWSANP